MKSASSSSEDLAAPSGSPQEPVSTLRPFRHAAFAVMWCATAISSIGTGMYMAASGWLMLTLNADPFVVSLVQVATSLPMFLFALPAGALADILDKRKLLIAVQIGATVAALILALLVSLGLVTPALLIAFTFLLGVGAAFTAPAWQAIVPLLVPKTDFSGAVAANGVGINLSRAIGPALAGVLITSASLAAPFWVNGISNIAVIAALMWWRMPKAEGNRLPSERLLGATITGLRHARSNQGLRAALLHALAFFLFASAYWALLPVLAQERITGGATMFGLLFGAIGAGAICGAFLMARLQQALSPNSLVVAGAVGTAEAMVILGLANGPLTALIGCAIAGLAWIAVLSSLNVASQSALPDWVRGRGLAIFATVFFGAFSAGGAIWGQVAAAFDVETALLAAAGGLVLTVPLALRWKLDQAAGRDLSPSMHWPTPIVNNEVEHDRGPVLIMIEYRIDSSERSAFLAALSEMSRERGRDGAYGWSVFDDPEADGRIVEVFYVASWIEHLRQHHRVTNADRILEDQVNRFQLDGRPKVTHLISV